MLGTVAQVNTSPGGIPKWPAPRARATRQGLEGDSWRNRRLHGGPRQALLLICAEALAEMVQGGFDVFPGALGENLTVRGLDRRQLRAGQRFRVGPDVIIELTKVRTPCATIDVYGASLGAFIYDAAVKQGDTSSPRWAMSGFYAAVLQPGEIRPGDPIFLLEEPA